MAERNLLDALDLRQLVCGIGNQLRYVDRFSTCRRNHRENVAEHQFYTAFFTFLICEHLELPLDKGKAVSRALIHDVEEHFTGDVIRPVKHGSEAMAKEMEKAGEASTEKFFDALTHDKATSEYLVRQWRRAKDNSMEGNVVRFADFLSVIAYLNQEVRSGNLLVMDNVNQLKAYCSKFDGPEFEFIRPLVGQAVKMVELLDGVLKCGSGRSGYESLQA